MKGGLEQGQSSEVERATPQHAPLEPYKLGDVLPRSLSILDMCRAFPVNGRVRERSSFHRLERQGKFRKFELPSISGRKAWSGAKVSRYLDGEPVTGLVLRPLNHKTSAV